MGRHYILHRLLTVRHVSLNLGRSIYPMFTGLGTRVVIRTVTRSHWSICPLWRGILTAVRGAISRRNRHALAVVHRHHMRHILHSGLLHPCRLRLAVIHRTPLRRRRRLRCRSGGSTAAADAGHIVVHMSTGSRSVNPHFCGGVGRWRLRQVVFLDVYFARQLHYSRRRSRHRWVLLWLP